MDCFSWASDLSKCMLVNLVSAAHAFSPARKSLSPSSEAGVWYLRRTFWPKGASRQHSGVRQKASATACLISLCQHGYTNRPLHAEVPCTHEEGRVGRARRNGEVAGGGRHTAGRGGGGNGAERAGWEVGGKEWAIKLGRKRRGGVGVGVRKLHHHSVCGWRIHCVRRCKRVNELNQQCWERII
jgi:hypothetical protein